MDPNVALATIKTILKQYEGVPESIPRSRVVDLFNAIEALDKWMTDGECLPEEWEWIREGK